MDGAYPRAGSRQAVHRICRDRRLQAVAEAAPHLLPGHARQPRRGHLYQRLLSLARRKRSPDVPRLLRASEDITEIRMLTSRNGTDWAIPTREPIVPVGDPGTSGAMARDWQSGAYAGPSVTSLKPDEFSIPVTPSSRLTTTRTTNRKTFIKRRTPALRAAMWGTSAGLRGGRTDSRP